MPDSPTPRRRRLSLTAIAGVILFVTTTLTVPHIWCGRDAGSWYRGDIGRQQALGSSVEAWVAKDLHRAAFHTGSSEFNGEWLLMTYQLAVLGFGQTAREHPTLAPHNLSIIERCNDRLVGVDMRAFDTEAWNVDALTDTNVDHGHLGYLGYTNVALSYERLLAPAGPHAAMNDRFTKELMRRFKASKTGLVETYPEQTYPTDNCVAMASIALHARATGNGAELAFVHNWASTFRRRYVDPRSGLLYQSVDSDTGDPGAPRASGTLFSAYFLSFVDIDLSRDLFRAVQRGQVTHVAGFGAIREYPAGSDGGAGDVDSGPVIFGLSTSGTAFALASARIHHDDALYRDLYSTLYLVGAPVHRGTRQTFALGGPLGDALLFALLTAQASEETP